jgi:pyruvate/2-oxoglutarate/acetoin dehydrogenase E1 component/TPP-dependent pyruvate/acetoin dehydrogenase alpha subunit
MNLRQSDSRLENLPSGVLAIEEAVMAETSTINRETLVQIYRTMVEIRTFEETIREMFQAGKLPRHGHLYAGQEAVAAGALAALNEDDYLATTHRGHGPTIARSHDFRAAMAELCGKETGCCGGKGGTMHICDFERAMLGAFPVVGASISVGAGGGLAARVLGNGRVSVAFFGDGASNQGTFHEALNLAAVWDLPVIFICENNGYAIFTSQQSATRVANIADRASAYGMPGVAVDGMDALAVYAAVEQAAMRARAGQGPTLIEAKTYRWGGHHTGDPGTGYRSREEVEAWKQRDPIPRLRYRLLESGFLMEAGAAALEKEVDRRMEDAIRFAFDSADPPAASAVAHVYAPAYVPEARQAAGEPRELTAIQALTEAIREEMERDPHLIVLGEDIGSRGGPYGVTKGLLDAFGPKRILDTPISENGFVAAAVGAALAGVPAIAEVSFIDFTTLALDPLVNVAAKAHYLSAGRQTVPLVLRTQEGGGAGGAATHSQCLEAWYTHIPGLKVVLPSTPADYKGLLKTAIRDPNPVVFIEHKMLYRTKGAVPSGDVCLPFGQAAVRRQGKHLTVVALAAMVPKALSAAERLAADGIEIEVIDPRTLVPLDVETIAQSVRRTGRLVVFQEAHVCGGFGSELARVIGKEAFDYLEAPIEVVGTTAPIPFSPALERIAIPGEDELIAAVRGALGRSEG